MMEVWSKILRLLTFRNWKSIKSCKQTIASGHQSKKEFAIGLTLNCFLESFNTNLLIEHFLKFICIFLNLGKYSAYYNKNKIKEVIVPFCEERKSSSEFRK